jgi:hypothetical protein
MFFVQAEHVVIQGLDLDATPAHPADASTGILIQRDSATIQNNEIRNATGAAVATSHAAAPSFVQVLGNNIHDSAAGVTCRCSFSAFSGNTVNGGSPALAMLSEQSVITSNVVVDGTVAAYGDDLQVSNNQITGTTVDPLIHVMGNRIGVTENSLSDTTGYGIQAETFTGGISTDVTIALNTFTRVDKAIRLYDDDPTDSFPLTATIGGSASEANTFIDSGGSLGDSSYLVQMDGAIFDVNAEYNNWGLCTAAEIEQEIHDKADDPSLGRVIYEPFIAPSSCSSTPTPTPTATPTPTPTPGPTRTVTIPPGSWANFAWTGASSPQTVADCFGTGNVAVMYRLDAASGAFQRWIRDRADLSNMGEVMRFDALLALNASAQPATCTMPDDVAPYTLTIPAGRWANFAWLAFSFPADVLSDACGVGGIAVAYRLDAATQTFQRWISGRPDLSNMTDIQPYDALLALNGSAQASTCTFSHYGQLAASSS